MPKHILPPQKSLSGQEQQTQDTKLTEFLKAVPFLSFSEKGLDNIARRFHISTEELKQKVADFEAKEARR